MKTFVKTVAMILIGTVPVWASADDFTETAINVNEASQQQTVHLAGNGTEATVRVILRSVSPGLAFSEDITVWLNGPSVQLDLNSEDLVHAKELIWKEVVEETQVVGDVKKIDMTVYLDVVALDAVTAPFQSGVTKIGVNSVQDIYFTTGFILIPDFVKISVVVKKDTGIPTEKPIASKGFSASELDISAVDGQSILRVTPEQMGLTSKLSGKIEVLVILNEQLPWETLWNTDTTQNLTLSTQGKAKLKLN